MKKLVLISTIMATCAGVSVFGQGYFQFQTGNSQVWDGFTTPAGPPVRDSLVNIAFLWAASGQTPGVAGIASQTSNTLNVANSTFSTTAAWAEILSDPNFTLAHNAGDSSLAMVTSTTKGGVNYAGGSAFGVQGTAAHVAYTLYMIGWSSAYATPQAAAAGANSYVGWSAPFAYTSYLFTDTPSNFANIVPGFSVAGTIPEPTTLALAGLGGLGLLLFRRKK